jgi:uncharacterized protein YwgA
MNEDLLKQIMKEMMLVEMKFTVQGGDASFTVYAHLEDAEKMLGYIKKLIQGITTKVREDLEKTNMVIPLEDWKEWNDYWGNTPQCCEHLRKMMASNKTKKEKIERV